MNEMENTGKDKKNTQIARGFEALTSELDSLLNPPLLDQTQEPLKRALDEAFETLSDKFSSRLGEVVECPDKEMINVINSAYAWHKIISSVKEAIECFRTGCSYEFIDGLERVDENKWVIKNEGTLKDIGKMLSQHYRTLRT